MKSALRCVRENEKAWRWYEREGFVLEMEAGRADDGVWDEILPMEETGSRPMMKLYWSPRSRSFSALWLMEETGQPYERVLTDISTGAQKTPEFLAINPMAQGAGAEGRRRDARGSRRNLRLCRRTLSRSETCARHWATRCARNIFIGCSSRRAASSLPWCRSQPRSKINPVSAGWGDAQRVFDVLDAALTEGPWILGETFSAADIGDRIGAEFRGAAVQDAAVAPVIRPLHRSLRGRPAGERAALSRTKNRARCVIALGTPVG